MFYAHLLQDIQGILEDLSSEIKTKIDKKDGTISCKGISHQSCRFNLINCGF